MKADYKMIKISEANDRIKSVGVKMFLTGIATGVILTLMFIFMTSCDKPVYGKYAQLTALGSDTITWRVGDSINQQIVTDWWTMTIPVYAGDTVRLSGKCQVYLTITEGDYVVWIQQCQGCVLEYVNN